MGARQWEHQALGLAFPAPVNRGEQIMLKNLPIMLCYTAPKMHLLCSTNVPIMLRLCSLNCQESVIIDI